MASDLITGYAKALFEIVGAEGELDRVSDELYRFSSAIEQNFELRTALTDIAIPFERKQALMDELLSAQASPHSRNLLGFLVTQNRVRELPEIVEALSSYAAQKRSMVVAEVRTAQPLDDDQKARLAESLKVATGKAVDIKVVVDPSVLGGVFVKVGDQIIDGTVRRRLQQLTERLEVQG